MNTLYPSFKIIAALLLVSFVLGCQSDNPVGYSSKQSKDQPPPGVQFLPRTMFGPQQTVNMSLAGGPQRGWDSRKCTSKSDTWIGSDTATYGNRVKFWHDALPYAWDTLTVTLEVVDNTEFGAVDFLPDIPNFKHKPEVNLCYTEYGITDDEAKAMKIYWWNPSTSMWDLINADPSVDSKKNLIKFTAPHFSRYAFAR